MSLALRLDAERRYDKIRTHALETAQQFIDEKFKLTKITPAALDQTVRWDCSAIRPYHWDWKRNYSHYSVTYPKRFEVALWENSTLVTISLGRPTHNGAGLRLDIIEAMPRDLGERSATFGTVIFAYEIYARMINANNIRIMNPVNETVKVMYEKFGYKYVAKGDYLIRGLL